MSIFRRSPVVNASTNGDDNAHSGSIPKRHEVHMELYYVRGRPFIAPTLDEGDLRGRAAQVQQQLELVQASISTSDARARRSSPVQTLSKRTHKQGAPRKLQTSLATSPAVADEEWAALFRNNLLRSCWKPGLKSSEVQHSLDHWEKKLIEVMHVFIHPELWTLYVRWRRRSMPRRTIASMSEVCQKKSTKRALKRLRSHCRIQMLIPFFDGQRLQRVLSDWCREAVIRQRFSSTRLLFPFRQVKHFASIMKPVSWIYRSSRHRRVRRSFRGWLSNAIAVRARKETIAGVLSGWMGGLRAAINTWKGRMEHFRMLRVYSARMVHMPVFVALRKWLRLVGSMRLLRRVVVTWGNMKAARALSGWKWSTYNRLRLRKLLASCLTPFPLRHIRRALNSWKSAARRMIERKKTWQQLRHAVATLSHQGIAKAIHKWEDCTRRRKAQLDLVDVALTKWTERRLPKAWNSWKYAPKGPYQRMPRVKKILAGFFKASLLKAFNTWVATLNKLNQAKRRLRGALNTLCHKGYRAAWLRWCEEWRERSRLVHGAELVYDLLQGSLTRRAWNSWLQHVDAKFAHSERLETVAILLQAHILRAINKWRSLARKRRRLKRSLNAFGSSLLRPFNTWLDAARHAKLAKERLAVSLGEFEGKGIRTGFFTWLEFVDQRQHLLLCFQTLMHKHLRQAMNTWANKVMEILDEADQLQSVVTALSPEGQKLRRALNSWLVFVQHTKNVSRALLALAENGLHRGFVSWLAAMNERIRKKEILGGALKSMQSMRQRRVYNRWHEVVCKRSIQMQLMQNAYAALRNDNLFRSFSTWHDAKDRRHDNKKLLKRSAMGLVSPLPGAFYFWAKRRMPLHLKKLTHLRQGKAFSTWHDLADKRASFYRILTFGASGIRLWKARAAYRTWIDFTSLQLSMSVAMRTFRSQGSRRALNGWLAYVHNSQSSPAKRAVAYFLNRELGCAMNQLREYARVVKIVHQVISTLQGSGLRKGMRTWAAYAEDRYYSMDALDIAVHKMCAKELSRAYESWAALLDRPIDIRERAISHMRSKEIVRAFHAWSSRAEELLMMSEAMANHSAGSSRRALNTWIEWAEEQGALADILRGSLARMARFPLVRMFSRWAQIASALVSSQRYGERIAYPGLACAWNTWCAVAQNGQLIRRAVTSLSKRGLMTGFNSWYSFTITAFEMQEAIASFSPERRALSFSFRVWKPLSEGRRRLRFGMMALVQTSTKRAFSSWVQAGAIWAASREQQKAALIKMSPEGRALTHSFHVMKDSMLQMRLLRNAASFLFSKGTGRALNSWRFFSLRISRERSRIRSVLSVLFNRPLKRGIRTWRVMHEELNRKRHLLTNGMISFRGGALRRALNSWRASAEKSQYLSQLVYALSNSDIRRAFRTWLSTPPHPGAIALGRWLLRPAAKAFSSWQSFAHEQELVLRAVRHSFERDASLAFSIWVEAAKLFELEAVARHAIFLMRKRAQARSFHSWGGLAETQQTALLRAREAGKALAHIRTRRAVNSWRACMKARLHVYELLRPMVSIMRGRRTKMALNTWRARADQVRRDLDLLGRAASSLRDRHSKHVLHKWRQSIAKLLLLRSAVSALMARFSRVAMSSWCSVARQRKANEILLRTAVASLLDVSLRHGFNAWRSKSLLSARVKGAVFSVCNRAIRLALNMWQIATRMGKEKSWRLRTSVSRMFGSALVKAVEKWHQATLDWMALRAVALNLQQPLLRAALNMWKILSVELAHRNRLMRRSFAALTAHKAVHAMRLWELNVSVERRALVIIRALSDLKMQQIRRAYRTWDANAQDFKQSERTIKTIFMKFLCNRASKAMNSWSSFVELQRHSLALLNRAAETLSGQNRVRAINTWRTFAQSNQNLLALMASLGNPMLHRAIKSWSGAIQAIKSQRHIFLQSFAALSRSQEVRALRRWSEAAFKSSALQAAAASIGNQPLRLALNSWCEVTEQVRRHADLLLLSVNAFGARSIRASFESWILYLEFLRPLRVFSPNGPALRIAVNTWCNAVQDASSQSLRRRRALAHMRQGALVRALDQWISWTEQRTSNLEHISHSVLALCQQVMHKTFMTWTELQQRRNRKRSMLRDSLARFLQWRSRFALSSWRGALKTQSSRLRLKRRAAAALFKQSLLHGLNTWCTFVEAINHNLALTRAAVAALFSTNVSRAYNKWCSLTEKAAALHLAASSIQHPGLRRAFSTWRTVPAHPVAVALGHWRLRPVASAFAAWKHRSDGTAVQRRALAHIVHKGLAGAFHLWFEHARLLKLAAQVISSLRGNGLRKGLRTWGAYTEDRETALQLMDASLHRMRAQELNRAYEKWTELLNRQPDSRARAFAHMRNKELARAFIAWTSRTEELLMISAALSSQMASSSRRALTSWIEWTEACAAVTQILRGSMAHMSRFPLARMFFKWAQRGAETAQVQAVVSMFFSPKGLSRALRSWQSFVEARRDTMDMIRLAALSFSPLGKVFGIWQSLGTLKTLQRRAAARCKLLRVVVAFARMDSLSRSFTRAKRSAAALFFRSTHLAFESWRARAMTRKEVKQTMARAINMLKPRTRNLMKAWNTWTSRHFEHSLLRRAAVTFCLTAFVRALKKWRAISTRAMELASLLSRAKEGPLERAFRRWACLPTRGPRKNPAERAARRWRRRPLARAFEKLHAQFELHQLLQLSLFRMTHSGLTRAFGAWIAHAEELDLIRMSMNKALQWKLTQGFNSWLEEFEKQAEINAQLRQGLLCLSSARRAFEAWVEGSTMMSNLQRAAAHLASSSLSCYWSKWCEHQRLELVQRRALIHFTGSGLVRALNGWEDFIRSIHARRQTTQRLLMHQEGAAFRRWSSSVANLAEKRAWLRIVVSDDSRLQRRAIRGWQAMCYDRNMERAALERAIHPAKGRALTTWESYSRARRLNAQRMHAALVSLKSGYRARFKRWVDITGELQLLRQSLARFKNCALARSFLSWAGRMQAAIELEMRIAAVTNMGFTGIARAFAAWRACATAVLPLEHSLAHWRNSQLSSAWCFWASYVVQFFHCQHLVFMCLNRRVARGLRTWQSWMDIIADVRHVVLSLINFQRKKAFNRWLHAVETREKKLIRMRNTLHGMAGGHRILKALNAWKAQLAVSRRKAAAFRSLIDHRWRRPLATSLNRWSHAREERSRRSRGAAHHSRRARRRGVDIWRRRTTFAVADRVADALVRSTRLKQAIKKWLRAHLLATMLLQYGSTGFALFLAASRASAIKRWRHEVARRAPMHRAATMMTNRPLARAMGKFKFAGRIRAKKRRALARWVGARMGSVLRKLKALSVQRNKLRRPFAVMAMWGQRKAITSWLQFMKERRRLREQLNPNLVRSVAKPLHIKTPLFVMAGKLCMSFLGPTPIFFRYWKAMMRNAKRKKQRIPLDIEQLRLIKPLTWRECCQWLTRAGLKVSRSPPTLLRTLREGGVYPELVRIASPVYYLRHRFGHIQERSQVFVAVQHFLDTEPALSLVGCQKLNVRALEDGKAIEHLELIAVFKALLVCFDPEPE